MDDDGRWHHKLRQSWLKTFTTCPERARREHTGEMEKVESDAANVGTAVHSAIETCLQDPLNEADAVEVFNMTFSDLMESPHWRWIKYNETSARAFGTTCVRHWHREVYPTLPTEGLRLELQFDVPFYEDDERVIDLSGTIDYFDGTLRDWKTSGGMPWLKWEHERWDLQPTIYTYASTLLGLTKGPVIPFEFVVLSAKGVDRITVNRRPADWDWLAERCLDAARMIEADLPAWVRNDAHALCSAKWCPAWSTCKGEFVDVRWPK